ncbi:hypothetical protein KAR48_08300 [bacterium]|nr:hypothetical protein [bacterium]
MILRCTQKLVKALDVVPESAEENEAPLSSWHANVFLIDRRKCVLVTHDATLFAMCIPGLKKPDFAVFHQLFATRLFKFMMAEEFPQKDIEKVLMETETMRFTKTNSRSVLGSMNDQKFFIEAIIAGEGGLTETDFYYLNRRLNHNRLSPIGNRHPIDVFRELLKNV